MLRPRLSWLPVRLMPAIMLDGTLTTEQWLHDARNKFGLDAVEMYFGFLRGLDADYVAKIARRLAALGLEVSQLCTSTDFTHPDPDRRAQERSYLRRAVVAADTMGAPGIRFVAGQRHPGVTDQQGIDWVISGLEDAVAFAAPYGVQIRLENHYRDKSSWELPDFAQRTEVFVELFSRIADMPVMINFDCSNSLMCDEDPLAILNVVRHKVVSVHASDRKRRSYQHSVLGQGEAPFDDIFATLAGSGFAGWISAEDGNPDGDQGFLKGLDFLRMMIDKHWAEERSQVAGHAGAS